MAKINPKPSTPLTPLIQKVTTLKEDVFSFLEKPLLPIPLWLQYVILAVVALGFYANTIQNEWAVDDSNVITHNKFTKQGLAGIVDILTNDSYVGNDSDEANKTVAAYYRPLSLVTFAIEYELFGHIRNPHAKKDFEPWPMPFHLTNILLYGLTIVLLFHLLKTYWFNHWGDLAFFTTLIYAIHPIHTEAVANVKGRDEMMSFFFIILSLIFLFRYIKRINTKKINLVWAVLTFFLAMLSKENGIMFLFITPIAIFMFAEKEVLERTTKFGQWLEDIFQKVGLKIRRVWSEGIAWTLPYLAVCLVFIGLRTAVLGVQIRPEIMDVGMNMYAKAKSKQEKYATITVVQSKYLKFLTWPYPLAWDYTYLEIPYYNFSHPYFWLSAFAIIIFLGFALWKIWDKNIIAFAILFYYISMFLVSNYVIDIGGFVGERFLYQSSLSIAIILGVGLIWFVNKLTFSSRTIRFGVAMLFLIGLTSVCFAHVFTRNQEWRKNETLFVKDVYRVPNSMKANTAAAKYMIIEAQDSTVKMERRLELIREAIPLYKKAVSLLPEFADLYVDLGNAFNLYYRLNTGAVNYLDSAAYYYAQIAVHNPTHKKIGGLNAYIKEMYSLEAAKVKDKPDEYVSYLEKIVKYDPQNAELWRIITMHYVGKNDQAKLLSTLEMAVKYLPNNPDAHFNLAVTYFNLRQYDKALLSVKRSLELRPNNPTAIGLYNETLKFTQQR